MAADVVRVEEPAHRLPERARLARRAVIGCRLADEREQLPRPRACGVEEIAIPACRVGSLEARAPRGVELAARLVVEERRRGSAARQRSLLEADHEHRLEASRAHVREVEHRDTTRLAGRIAPNRRPVERGEDVVLVDRDARRAKALQLVEDPRRRVRGPEVALRGGCCGWRTEAVRVAEHREHGDSGGGERLLLGGEELEHRQRPAGAQLRRLLDRAVAAEHGAAAQSALEEVDVGAAEAAVRRAEEREELAAGAVAPGEAEQREERLPERGRGEPWPRLDGDRDAERAERRLERRPRTVERRADDRDLLGPGAVPYELEHGLGDELEGGPATGTLEEANRAVERGRRRVVVEEVALEVGEPGRKVGLGARRELDDVAFRERGEVVGRALQRGERRACGLVRE